MSDTKPEILEAQETPSRINIQETTPKHITIDKAAIKDKRKS